MTQLRVRNKLIFRIDSTFPKQIQIAIILSMRSNRILFDILYDIRRNAQHASLRESESGVLTPRDTRVPIYLYTQILHVYIFIKVRVYTRTWEIMFRVIFFSQFPSLKIPTIQYIYIYIYVYSLFNQPATLGPSPTKSINKPRPYAVYTGGY